jgi:hypothetical protein
VPSSSLEARWFFDGALDPRGDVVGWFGGGASAASPDPGRLTWPPVWREDTYLLLPERPDIGVKVRREDPAAPGGGRLEFKGRTEQEGPVAFGEVGRPHGDSGAGSGAPAAADLPPVAAVERWVKWSCTQGELPGALARLFAPRDGSLWTTVRKKRLLRRIQLRPDPDAPSGYRPVEVDPSVWIDRGVGVEVTRIEVVSGSGDPGGEGSALHAAWTVGIEAFPADVQVASEFAPVVRAFLEGFPEPALLTADASMGYPAWLARGRPGP